MLPVIVYTRHDDGGVTLCTPTTEVLAWLSCGGYWPAASAAWLEEQVKRSVAAGHNELAVRRYIRAMRNGGCSTAQAYAIIRDRDCGHLGTGFELWDRSDLPPRSYRDAWRRSGNGGPIRVDMAAARKVQWRRIKSAIVHHNRQRLELGRSLFRPPWLDLSRGVRRADDPEALQRVWPAFRGA